MISLSWPLCQGRLPRGGRTAKEWDCRCSVGLAKKGDAVPLRGRDISLSVPAFRPPGRTRTEPLNVLAHVNWLVTGPPDGKTGQTWE